MKHTLSIDNTLKITEIFYSLQGESKSVGLPTVFVRLTGCPLRCVYCDTAYAFQGGERQSVQSIVEVVKSYPTPHVTVTGGEPLAQPAVHLLMQQLCDAGCEVSIETAGALDITVVDPRVRIVMDLKTPDSQEEKANRYDNIPLLKPTDEVKFVIGSRQDYDWSVAQCKQYNLYSRCEVLFSPSYGVLEPATLADWVVQDRLPVRMQVQLHKILWGERSGC